MKHRETHSTLGLQPLLSIIVESAGILTCVVLSISRSLSNFDLVVLKDGAHCRSGDISHRIANRLSRVATRTLSLYPSKSPQLAQTSMLSVEPSNCASIHLISAQLNETDVPNSGHLLLSHHRPSRLRLSSRYTQWKPSCNPRYIPISTPVSPRHSAFYPIDARQVREQTLFISSREQLVGQWSADDAYAGEGGRSDGLLLYRRSNLSEGQYYGT